MLKAHMETGWTTVTRKKRHEHQETTSTVIIKLLDAVDLSRYPPLKLAKAVKYAAGVSPTKRRNTYIRLRFNRNLIAVDTYKTSVQGKLHAMREFYSATVLTRYILTLPHQQYCAKESSTAALKTSPS